MIKSDIFYFLLCILFPIPVTMIYGMILERKHKVYHIGKKQFEDAFPKMAVMYILAVAAGGLVIEYHPPYYAVFALLVVSGMALYAVANERKLKRKAARRRKKPSPVQEC